MSGEKEPHRADRYKGLNAALLSAFLLGLTPIFGKQAINAGLTGLGVVAYRTFFAALLLFLFMAAFQRKYLYIYPVGLVGCLIAGWVNGLGSLFFYSALGRLDAGIGQLLYSLYPFFVVFWMLLDGQVPSRLTTLRLVLVLPAILLLVQSGGKTVDIVGVLMMLVASVLYALHLPINQRVLVDIPAPTVTLYTLLAMTAMVGPVYLFSSSAFIPQSMNIWTPLIGLTIVTLLSRVMLFLGVKNIGGVQTAIIGLGELVVTLALAQVWLHESLTKSQWIGAALLVLSILLSGMEKPSKPMNIQGGWFSWFSPSNPRIDKLDFDISSLEGKSLSPEMLQSLFGDKLVNGSSPTTVSEDDNVVSDEIEDGR